MKINKIKIFILGVYIKYSAWKNLLVTFDVDDKEDLCCACPAAAEDFADFAFLLLHLELPHGDPSVDSGNGVRCQAGIDSSSVDYGFFSARLVSFQHSSDRNSEDDAE